VRRGAPLSHGERIPQHGRRPMRRLARGVAFGVQDVTVPPLTKLDRGSAARSRSRYPLPMGEGMPGRLQSGRRRPFGVGRMSRRRHPPLRDGGSGRAADCAAPVRPTLAGDPAPTAVTPAKAGVHPERLRPRGPAMDSGFRRNDGEGTATWRAPALAPPCRGGSVRRGAPLSHGEMIPRARPEADAEVGEGRGLRSPGRHRSAPHQARPRLRFAKPVSLSSPHGRGGGPAVPVGAHRRRLSAPPVILGLDPRIVGRGTTVTWWVAGNGRDECGGTGREDLARPAWRGGRSSGQARG